MPATIYTEEIARYEVRHNKARFILVGRNRRKIAGVVTVPLWALPRMILQAAACVALGRARCVRRCQSEHLVH